MLRWYVEGINDHLVDFKIYIRQSILLIRISMTLIIHVVFDGYSRWK